MPGIAIFAVDVAVGTAILLPPVPVPAGGGSPGGGAVLAGMGAIPGGRATAVPVAAGGVVVAGGGAVVGVGVVGATVWATGGAMPVTVGPVVAAGVAGVAGVACAGCVVLVLLGPETREPPPLTGSTGPPVVTTQPTANIEPTAAAANHLNSVSFISVFS